MDAPLALYRRYRPDTFAQVIGQDHVTEPLRAALRNNRVNHAYLFSGPRGCGKTTSARILARAMNCAKGPAEEPCGSCDSCVELATGGPGSIDVIEIDAASHGRVEDARDLREQATFQPMRDRYKIYIIDEAHMVTTQGFNALLKIVEEPPAHVRFIFATTEPEKVIGTIRSRTHHYPFRLIPPRILSTYLRQICEREQVAVEPAALPLVVRAGGGSARDTLSVLDQLIGGAGQDGVTYNLTAGLLGFTPDTLLDEVVDAFAAHDGGAVFGVVDKIIETGQDPRRFTEDLLQRLRDLVVISAVPDAPATGLIDVPEDQAERLVAQSARFGRHDLSRAADMVAQGLTDLKGTTAPRLLLELLCARVLLPGADDSSLGTAARLDRLEKRISMAPLTQVVPAATPAAQPDDAPRVKSPPVEPSTVTPSTVAPSTVASSTVAPSTVEPSAAEPAPVEPPHQQQPPRPERPREEAAPVQAAQPPPAAAPVAGLSLVDVRRLWPDVVEAVKAKRRVTWIQLSQHAQVIGLDGRTLTLGFNNPGARESFVNGRSDVILQQVLIDLVGQEWTIEAINDPSAQPGTDPPVIVTKPAVPAAPQRPPTAPGHSQSAPEVTERPQSEAGPVDADADRDDPDAEDLPNGTELLSQRLGARVIEEIPHD